MPTPLFLTAVRLKFIVSTLRLAGRDTAADAARVAPLASVVSVMAALTVNSGFTTMQLTS